MSYKDDLEKADELLFYINDNKKLLRYQVLSFGLVSFEVHRFLGVKGLGFFLYLFTGFKLATYQGYGKGDWELYVLTFLWPVIVLVDTAFKVMGR